MAEFAEWVRLARDGDAAAYGQLFRQFQDMAVGYAFALLGDFHEAEDAAQEAFVTAFQRLSQVRTADAFPGWLRRVVHTHANRIGRRHRESLVLDEARTTDERALDPAVIAERRDQSRRIIAAVNALPAREREAVSLHYVGGYTSAEIGVFLSVPPSTIRRRLQAARRLLKEEVMSVQNEMQSHRPSRNHDLGERVCRFLAAAGCGSTRELEAAIKESPGLVGMSAPHPYGWKYDVQALHVAAQWGQDDKVRLLLDRGADPEALDGTGCTPLLSSIVHRRMSTARLLAERGATLDVRSAAALSETDRVRELLAADPCIPDRAGGYWCTTPLHWAGSVEMARLLLEHGADARARDGHGNTPMRWAAGYCAVRPGVAEFLAGQTGDGDIFTACALGQAEEVRRRLDADPSLMEAAIGPWDACSTAFLYPRFTPLHLAVFHRRSHIVRLLIDRGADVHAAPAGGFMPIHVAAAFGDAESVQLLLDAGAKLDIADTVHHGTPRAWAEFWHQPEMAAYLADRGG